MSDQVCVANDFSKSTISNVIYLRIAVSASWLPLVAAQSERAAAGWLSSECCCARVMLQQRCQCDCVHVSEAMRMLLRRYNSV